MDQNKEEKNNSLKNQGNHTNKQGLSPFKYLTPISKPHNQNNGQMIGIDLEGCQVGGSRLGVGTDLLKFLQ